MPGLKNHRQPIGQIKEDTCQLRIIKKHFCMKIIAVPFILVFTLSFAQQKATVHDYSVIKPSQWVIPRTDTLDYAFGRYLGQKALLLKRKIGNYKSASIAYVKGLEFKDGIIEMDAAWPGERGGYLGLAFRIKDAHHYESVYFRPESSGTINAIQYMPEKKTDYNWWDYEADKYQAKTTLPLHGWFHVKVTVNGNKLTVFVNRQATPAFVYSPLDGSLKSGSVGFWLGNCQAAAYKNLVVTTF